MRLPPGDLDSVSGRARLYYQHAAELFETATRGMRGGQPTVHQLRHGSVTHAAEDGTCTSLLACSGQLSSLAGYARVSPEPSAAGRHSATRPSGGFRFAAGLTLRRQGAEVQVLEGNLRRVIGAEASGGELRALSRLAMRSDTRYWLEAFRLPVVPVDRLVGVPVDQRGPVIARYREAAGRVAGPGLRGAA